MAQDTAAQVNPDEAWELYVPPGTRDNYNAIARDTAKVEGSTPKAILARMRKAWEDLHKDRPGDGFNYLAAWAKANPDPGDGATGDTPEAALSRAVESARREPRVALEGHPAAVEAAVEAVKAGLGTAPSGATAPVDPDGGVIPNTGPVSTDVGASASDQGQSDQQ